MTKILITGGAGYIGSVLSQYLLDKGHDITVIDNMMYKQENTLFTSVSYGKKFKFIPSDIRNSDLLKDVATENEIIIPLACLVGAPLCDKNPEAAWDINYKQISNLLCLNKKIIYPTTNSGYGVGGDLKCDENSPLNPISIYGKTKVKAELDLLNSKSGISFRLATVFGASPRMRLDLLVNDFVWKAKRDGVLVLFESHFRRNYIHIKDVCKAFNHAINNYESMRGNSFNVGLSSANLTKLQLAEKIKEHIPNTVIINSSIGQDPDKRDYLVSNDKLEATGWKPDKTLDDGIEEIIKIYDMIKCSGDKYRNY